MNTRDPQGTEEQSADHWRAGCECARAGLCYRCRAAHEIERLQKEVRVYRSGFEGALRYLAEEVYDDVRAPFDPKCKGFTPEYANDLASMRAARKLLP
jgi:hypothetical protein